MGLLTGTVSCVRYHVIGEEPDPFWPTIDERIRAFAFEEQQGVTEETSLGWVGLDSMLDTEFASAGYSCGDYVVMSFRVDRKKIPASLIKKHVLEAEQKRKQEQGRARVSRQEKIELREQARLKLMAGVLPVPTLYDVCWCISKRWLIFGGTAPKIRNDFENFFSRCFEMKLLPYLVWDVHLVPGDVAGKLLSLEPQTFCP